MIRISSIKEENDNKELFLDNNPETWYSFKLSNDNKFIKDITFNQHRENLININSNENYKNKYKDISIINLYYEDIFSLPLLNSYFST